MDNATKTRIDAAKTASERVVQKTAEATGDLKANKIADRITSIGKPKEKEKAKELEEIFIPPEKRQQIIDDLRLLGSLWNYFKDEPSDPLSSNSKSFKFKTNIVGKRPEDNINRCKNCYSTKTFKLFLECFKYTISKLRSRIDFNIV